MEIVDTHIHFWTPDTHSWVHLLKGTKFVENTESYLPENYKKDTIGYNITHCVHVEACWPGDPVKETRWLDDLAESNSEGFPQGIIGYADLSSENIEDVLKQHCQSKRMRGIRHMRHFNPYVPDQGDQTYFLSDSKWLTGMSLLEKYNLSFQHHFLPHQMKLAASVMEKFPNIYFMIDHCGLPYERNELKIKEWKEGLELLVKYPNVFCKVSGLFLDPHWNEDSIINIIITCMDIFGPDRCVFASDFPVDRINGTFSQLMTIVLKAIEQLSKEDQYKFFVGNAKKFYRLNSV